MVFKASIAVLLASFFVGQSSFAMIEMIGGTEETVIDSMGNRQADSDFGKGLENKIQGNSYSSRPNLVVDRTSFPKPLYQLEMDLYLFSFEASLEEVDQFRFKITTAFSSENVMKHEYSTKREAVGKWSRSREMKAAIRESFLFPERAREAAIFPIIFLRKSLGYESELRGGVYTYPASPHYEGEQINNSVRVTGLSNYIGPGASVKVSKVWLRPILDFDLSSNKNLANRFPNLKRLLMPTFEIPVSSIELVSGYNVLNPLRLKHDATERLQDIVMKFIEDELTKDQKLIKALLKTVSGQRASITLIADNYENRDSEVVENILMDRISMPMEVLRSQQGVMGSIFSASKKVCLKAVTGRRDRL